MGFPKRPERSTESLRNRYERHVKSKIPTGNPKCPEATRRAKRLDREWKGVMAIVDDGAEADADGALDEDGLLPEDGAGFGGGESSAEEGAAAEADVAAGDAAADAEAAAKGPKEDGVVASNAQEPDAGARPQAGATQQERKRSQ